MAIDDQVAEDFSEYTIYVQLRPIGEWVRRGAFMEKGRDTLLIGSQDKAKAAASGFMMAYHLFSDFSGTTVRPFYASEPDSHAEPPEDYFKKKLYDLQKGVMEELDRRGLRLNPGFDPVVCAVKPSEDNKADMENLATMLGAFLEMGISEPKKNGD